MPDELKDTNRQKTKNAHQQDIALDETMIDTTQTATSLFAERYQIISTLGEGAMGKVLEVLDTKTNKKVALKIIKKEDLDQELVKRFFREADLLNKLNHPHIVNVHACGQYQGKPYFTMDIVAGKTLKDILTEKKTPFKKRIRLLVPVIEAIHNAHENNVVHRDLKPANIMITDEGKPIVMDFGIAHKDDEESTKLTRTGMVLGTPMYMSPEQINGEKVTPRTDIYALGVILYELITEKAPFNGNFSTLMWKIGHEEPINPCQINNKIPKNLANVCLKALKKNPQERYKTARQMANDLKRYLQGKKVAAKVSKSPQEKIIAWSKKNKSILVSTCILMIALFVGFGRDSNKNDLNINDKQHIVEVPDNTKMVISEDTTPKEEIKEIENKNTSEMMDSNPEENSGNMLNEEQTVILIHHVNVCQKCYNNATKSKIILSSSYSDWNQYSSEYINSILLHIQEWDGQRKQYPLGDKQTDKLNQHIQKCSHCLALCGRYRIEKIIEKPQWEIYDPIFIKEVIAHTKKEEKENELAQEKEKQLLLEREKQHLQQKENEDREKQKLLDEKKRKEDEKKRKEDEQKRKEDEHKNNKNKEINPKKLTHKEINILILHIGRPSHDKRHGEKGCDECFEKARKYGIIPRVPPHGSKPELDWSTAPEVVKEIWKHANENN